MSLTYALYTGRNERYLITKDSEPACGTKGIVTEKGFDKRRVYRAGYIQSIWMLYIFLIMVFKRVSTRRMTFIYARLLTVLPRYSHGMFAITSLTLALPPRGNL